MENLQKQNKKIGCFGKILIGVVSVIALIFVAAFISVILEDSDTQKITINVDNPAEITQYIGKDISYMEQALGVKTTDMSEYQNFENVHRVNQNGDLSFDVTVDVQGNIIKIVLYDSGKKGYTMCGVNSNTPPDNAKSILENNGYVYVRENIWMSSDEKDEIKYSEKKWIYEKDSSSLQDEILRSKAEANFKYKYEDSVGATYIGNGQIVEYFHESYAEMFYQYEHHTDYQKQILNDKYNGRYIKILGQVTAVSNNGTITVHCQDDEASKTAELIWPMQGIAEVHLVKEQESELPKLKKDDSVLIYAQVDFSTYGRILNTFDVYNGILVAVGQSQCDIPYISSVSDGIYTFSEQTQPPKAAENVSNSGNSFAVTSSDEAIQAVKDYGKKEGWSDPYDMYETNEYNDYYLVFSGHSYLGDDWIEDTYCVDKNDKNNVTLVKY